MKKYLLAALEWIKHLPRKAVLFTILGVTLVIIVLKFYAKGVAVDAKEANLGALIEDAITKTQLALNKEKRKELDKPVKKEDLKKDPKEVEDFYKKNL